jgi:hypothetical protein
MDLGTRLCIFVHSEKVRRLVRSIFSARSKPIFVAGIGVTNWLFAGHQKFPVSADKRYEGSGHPDNSHAPAHTL